MTTGGRCGMAVKFGVLGPVQVLDDGVPRPLPATKQRTALAVLLLRVKAVVPMDVMIESLWPDQQPPDPRGALHTHVMRLRKTLGPEAGSRVRTVGAGYTIDVEDPELDSARFAGLAACGAAALAEDRHDDASDAFRSALALWRGEPLADVPVNGWQLDEVARLAELRWLAVENWIAADLRGGRYAQAIAELRGLARAHPFRERFHEQLMHALYAVDRRAEALEVYRAIQRVLAEELGIEPGPALRELYQAILAGDRARVGLPRGGEADGCPEPGQGRRPGQDGLRQLPVGPAQFTGRAGEPATLTGLLDRQCQQRPGTVLIAAIDGMPGVGKTALALHESVMSGDQRDPFGRTDLPKLPVGEAAAGDSSPISTAAELAAELRAWLREFERRSGRGMSRRRLAGALNVSVRSVYAYLSGTTLIPYEVLDRLLPVLEVSSERAQVLRRARDRVEEARRRPAEPVVQELPPSSTAFTGRAGPLAELGQLEAGQRTAGAAVVCVLAGTAGVGKTALALAWAHGVRERFPDGCLFVNLRGYDPEEPLDVHEALGVLLRSLGLADAELPAGLATRISRYRTLAHGRRMLIVLDNAFSADQVRPLLPAVPSCFVLVTSRDDLAGLVALDGAHRIVLPPLTWNEGLVLLEALLGAHRVRAEEQPARALVKVCAGLPLALRLAAEFAAARPGEPLAAIANEIRDQRLVMLAAAGDERADVRAVLSWSYLRLAADYPGAARAFRALGCCPGQDFDARSAAALLNTAPGDVIGLIDILVRGHLAERGPGRRFRMHDLLRAYAAELSAACDDAKSREAGLVRLARYYALSAEEAASHLMPQARETSSGLDSSHAAAPIYLTKPAFADAGSARAWLDAERPNLVAVAVAASDRGLSGYASRLSAALDSYLDSAAHYHDALTVHGCVTGIGDVTARHAAQVRLATACFRLGRLDEALVHAQQALGGALSAGDLQTEVGARLRLGALHACRGQLKAAREQCEAALTLARQADDRLAEERILGNLAAVYAEQQHYHLALENGRRAIELARELGDRVGEAHALCNVSRICQLAGRYQDAAAFGQKAQAAAAGIGDRLAQANATAALAASCMQLGRYSEARGHFLEAIVRAKDIGDRSLEVTVEAGLHEVTQRLRLPPGQYSDPGPEQPCGIASA